MKERKVLLKEVPIRHNSHILRNIMLMSVGVGVVTLFNKFSDPRKNFSVRKI